MNERRKRVLVVDDNRDTADTLVMLLEAEGCDSVAAYSGSDALATAEHLHPDLVIIDLFMPRMGGDELARLLRAGEHGEHMVLVAYTAMEQHLEDESIQQAGFDHHLVKPALPEDLLALARDRDAPLPAARPPLASRGVHRPYPAGRA
jgi:CheY-like chemotaxis protein